MNKTFYIIDNETATINRLKELFSSEFRSYHCIGHSGTYEESMNMILKHSPDLVFANLDLTLNDESVFSFARELEDYKKNVPTFIGVSSSKEKAYKVLKSTFFDLLLDPVRELDLRMILSKFEKHHNLEPSETLCLKSYSDYRFINTDDILYLKADNNATDFFMSDGKVVTGYETMKIFENILPNNFVRIHHSYIVNRNHVTRIHLGKLRFSINKTPQNIPFSRTYKDNVEFLKEAMEKASIMSPN